uniref:Uncharacterized protein LOC103406687 n=1 Tax=Rhizophora mucronata TaxID=61149 RepID=A0A2P2JMX9_RHIMU
MRTRAQIKNSKENTTRNKITFIIPVQKGRPCWVQRIVGE